MSVGKVDYASEVAALKFREGRLDVWNKTNLLREPLFIQSIVIISIYGVGNVLIQVLNKTNIISLPAMEYLYPISYLSPILGGLYLAGGLNIKRARMAIISMLIFAAFKYVVFRYYHDKYYIIMLQAIPGLWLMVWLMVKEPDIASCLGIRKKNILRDTLQALVISSTVFAYVAYAFVMYGVSLKYDVMKNSADFTSTFIQGLFINIYYYSVWRILKSKGANALQDMLALLIVFSVIQAPAFIAFALMGIVKPQLALTGFVMNTIITVMVMHFSFSALKNSLTATFLMAMIILLLKMMGIV